MDTKSIAQSTVTFADETIIDDNEYVIEAQHDVKEIEVPKIVVVKEKTINEPVEVKVDSTSIKYENEENLPTAMEESSSKEE